MSGPAGAGADHHGRPAVDSMKGMKICLWYP